MVKSVTVKSRFLNYINDDDSWKIELFLMTSFPVRMTSPQSDFEWKSRSWVDLSDKKILIGLDQPTAC